MAYPRASTKTRGYTGQHVRLQKQWRPIVQAGQAWCHALICLKPTRWIQPGTPWNLGHTPDRTAWTGPEHEQCNKSEGATRGNRMRRHPRWTTPLTTPLTPLTTSRRW